MCDLISNHKRIQTVENMTVAVDTRKLNMYAPEYETWQEIEGQLNYELCDEIAQRVVRSV